MADVVDQYDGIPFEFDPQDRYPGCGPLTLKLIGCIGPGGNNGGAGGDCALTTTPSIISGATSGNAATPGSQSYFYGTDAGGGGPGPGGSPSYYGGPSGNLYYSGGLGSDNNAGGGAAGAAGAGSSGVTITGGAGGSNGTYTVLLHGGKGGDQNQNGVPPGGGGALGKQGADGRVILVHTPVTASLSGDLGTDPTASVSIPSTTTLVGNVTGVGNPQPALNILPVGNSYALFEFDDNGDGSFALIFSSPPYDGVYNITIQGVGFGTVTQDLTITVGSSPPPPDSSFKPNNKLSLGIGLGI